MTQSVDHMVKISCLVTTWVQVTLVSFDVQRMFATQDATIHGLQVSIDCDFEYKLFLKIHFLLLPYCDLMGQESTQCTFWHELLLLH